ncbi:MAG: pro-sigmaK processing inhibitor BofA family protein [Clostridia bacterium]|nr:pro-sigmaK processing inhibitor BofA family protein [Clostridia bacterium]MBQ6716726.1 pro-sigmaK processing inhibitor BofA family protein [Clostridia bacterium]
MPIPWPVALMFVIGIVLVALVGRLLLIPGKFIWRILANGVAGALLLLGINLLSGFTGFSLPLNPFSALTAGFLGVPGILLLICLSYLL